MMRSHTGDKKQGQPMSWEEGSGLEIETRNMPLGKPDLIEMLCNYLSGDEFQSVRRWIC